jgi:hypothetical protein
VIQIVGHHFHNEPHHQGHDGPQFVRETLIRNLLGEGDEVTVAAGPLAGKTVPVKELGIGFPVIVDASNPRPVRVQRPGAGEKPAAGVSGQDDEVEEVKLRRYDFTVQFCWQPTVPGSDKPKTKAAGQPNAAPAAAENW